jgi:hypothetical protein
MKTMRFVTYIYIFFNGQIKNWQKNILLSCLYLLSPATVSNSIIFAGCAISQIRMISIVLSSVVVLTYEILPMDNSLINAIVNTAAGTTMPSSSSLFSSSLPTVMMQTTMTLKSPYYYLVSYGMKDSHNIAISVGASTDSSTYYTDSRRDRIIGNNNGDKNNKKFVHSGLRLEQNVFNALQEEAQKRGVSFNNLVSKILKNYVTSDMYFEQLGFILVSKDFLRNTFSGLDQKYLEELGREVGLTIAKEYITYFFLQVNTNTLIQFLDIWFSRFQFYQHRVKNDIVVIGDADVDGDPTAINEKEKRLQQIHVFIIGHDINMNFSLVLKAVLEGLVEPITKSPVVFKEITSTSITFLIKF